MSQNQYFRAGTGCVIYNAKNEILVFYRSDIKATWQLQQGGMDENEKVEDTLWRELFEETALIKSNFIEIHSYPGWLFYEYPDSVKLTLNHDRHNCLGQTHQWFFLKLNPGVKIDLSKAPDKEFTDFKWTSFPELLQETKSFKKPVYEKLYDYFNEFIN